jgi:hypothetical protein
MSDEPRIEERGSPPWAAAVLVVATVLSYAGLFARILWSDFTSSTVIVFWVLITAVLFRLGMRALKRRHESAPP